MAKTKKSAGKKTAPLAGIQPEEAACVLQRLLAIHPELVPEAEEIWRLSMDEVSFETIAFDVESSILSLDLDDLNNRAGSHSWGYVEPSEAALELLDEAVAPFREDMLRKLELGLEAAAFETCKGIVFGLYQCRNPTEGDPLSWAPDFPVEAASYAVCKLNGDRKPGAMFDFGEFVDEYVSEWQWLAGRAG